jgi:hypothetical protein
MTMLPGLRPLDFDEFHRSELPARLAAGNGRLASPVSARLEPIAYALPDGRAYTYVPVGDGVEVRPGDADAAHVVVMDETTWSEYVHELRTCYGVLYANSASASRGRLDHLIAWEPAVRAMFQGRPIYDPDTVDLRDRDGAPLDLHRSFTLDDDPADLRHFLLTTGFAHVRSVIPAGELAAIVAEVERLQAAARPGDDRSWWARDAAGANLLCRLIFVEERSPFLAGLIGDARITGLVETVRPEGAQLVPEVGRGDGISVVIKNPGAVEGLSDLPWHVDCGLGGHPVMCPSVAVAVQLDAATAETGQLHFLAGSWRTTSMGVASPRQLASDRYPTVAVTTEPGDVTIHLAHGLHAAPPPTSTSGAGRRALYFTFVNPLYEQAVPAGHGYNDLVLHSGPDNVVSATPTALA